MEFLEKIIPSKDDDDKNVDLAMLLITMSLPNPEKPYNIYKYSKYEGFYNFMSTLDDMIVVISFELFLDALESCGVSVNDSPGYRTIASVAYRENGVKLVDETYEIYDMLRADIYKVIKSEYDIEHETGILMRFLDTVRHYTNINSVIARMYDILHKYGEKLISISDEAALLNQYGDVLGIHDIENGHLHNDFMLEYVTTDIKEKGLFAFTYYEYIGKIHVSRDRVQVDTTSGIVELFKRFINGEDISDIDELEMIE